MVVRGLLLRDGARVEGLELSRGLFCLKGLWLRQGMVKYQSCLKTYVAGVVQVGRVGASAGGNEVGT